MTASRAPRHVAFAKGKSALRHMPDLVTPHAAQNAARAEALVLPASQATFDDWMAQAPPEGWRHLAETRALIVFDASEEGVDYRRTTFAELHAFLARVGLSTDQAVYLTQNRFLETDYAADPPDAGERMRVLTYDYYVRRFFEFDRDGESVFEERLARFKARAPRRPHRFISLNYTLRKSKFQFLLQAAEGGLLDGGLISIGDFAAATERFADLMRHPAFAKKTGRLAHQLPALARFGDVRLGHYAPGETRGPTVTNTEMQEQDDCWFTVITETEMGKRPIRFTEKALKPLVNFHPFLMLGNPGTLAGLRDLGFETFAGVYDETYDDVPGAGRRFNQVYEQFRRLCAADESDLARQEAALAERLIHNARWGLTKVPAMMRQRDEAFFARLFEGR